MAGSKKDGGANLKYYDFSETLESLENVRQWLIKNCKKVNAFFHGFMVTI